MSEDKSNDGIKILKRGVPPGDETYLLTCWNCKSELEAKAKHGEISGQREDLLSFVCPVCSKIITASKEQKV